MRGRASDHDSTWFRGGRLILKRCVDLVLATMALILLLPSIGAIALAIRMIDGSPVFFRQMRPGWGGRPFVLVKFRTMREPRPNESAHDSDARRVTSLGRILRKSSLDELPELWNVVRGDMSLVGPRPLLMQYLNAYDATERRRHEMRPGITGWAVVRGRHSLAFEQRLKLDVWYVEHWGLLLDARILVETVLQFLRRADVAVTQDFDDIALPERFQKVLGQRDGDAASQAFAGSASGGLPPPGRP